MHPPAVHSCMPPPPHLLAVPPQPHLLALEQHESPPVAAGQGAGAHGVGRLGSLGYILSALGLPGRHRGI